jgi:hypothetical protein
MSAFSLRPIQLALLGVMLSGTALAQSPDRAPGKDIVSWTASVQRADKARQGGRVDLTLHGSVLPGWHVYGLEQLPAGPTPLRVTVETNEFAVADGTPTASPPTKVLDPSFRLETQYYSQDFNVVVPVRLGPDLDPETQQIPVSVRFQTCNDRTCQPPKTVRLSAPIAARTGG